MISDALPSVAAFELSYFHHLLSELLKLALYVVLPLLDYAVLRLNQLEWLEDTLIRFLDEVEHSEGLEDVQRHVAHVSVETDQGLQRRVSVEVYLLFLDLDFYSLRLMVARGVLWLVTWRLVLLWDSHQHRLVLGLG